MESIKIIPEPTGIISYNITGRVVDSTTKESLKDIIITLKDNKNTLISGTTTNKEGIYNLYCEIDIDKLREEENKITIYYDPYDTKYVKSTYIPLTSDFNIKENIKPIELEPILASKNKIISDVTNVPKDVIKNVKKKIKTEGDWIKNLFKNSINNIFKNLIPIVITLLLSFGITKLNQKKNQCPSREDLLIIIRKRNNLVKVLNTIYKTIDLILAANAVGLTLIRIFKIAQRAKIYAPTPIIEYTPHSIIHIKQESIKKIQKYIDKYEGINVTIILYGSVLKEVINLLLSYLKMLDESIKDCYNEMNLDHENPIGLESYIDPLLEVMREINKSEEKDYKTFHKGFEIKVINSNNNAINGIFRRQAIGINPQGITIIKGEPSFSSSDEILKNELIFYININKLKAY